MRTAEPSSGPESTGNGQCPGLFGPAVLHALSPSESIVCVRSSSRAWHLSCTGWAREMNELMSPARDRTGGREEDNVAKEDRGFASMDRAKQREIASKGGKAAHQKGTAHEWTSEEARDAGRKGGIASHRRRREQLASTLGSDDTRTNSSGDTVTAVVEMNEEE